MKKNYNLLNSIVVGCLLLISSISMAQLDITTLNTDYVIDFDATMAGVNNGVYDGTGVVPVPAAGQLDGDAWEITGFSNGNHLFGDSNDVGDFAKGTSTGGIFSGGMYGFDVSNGGTANYAFGIQPTGGDFTPGTVVLKVANNTPATSDSVRISYDIYVNNDGDRGNSWNPSVSSDNVTYTDLTGQDYTSVQTSQGSVNWIMVHRDTTVALSVATGDHFYVRWSSADETGSGNRDEFAMDNITIQIVGTAGPLSAAISASSNVSCNGYSDGAATVTASNGTPSYTYAWSNGATTASISGLVAGTYTVTVTDAAATTAVATATVTEPVALSVTASATTLPTTGQSNGAATATVSGGTSPYNYLWSTGWTTMSISNLFTGTYTVTISDGNGCTTSGSITLNNASPVTASISTQTNVTCNGLSDGSATVGGNGGAAPYTFAWNTGATTATVSGLAAGMYTVTVTDNSAATSVTTVTITQPSPLSYPLGINQNVSCNGLSDGEVQVTAAQNVVVLFEGFEDYTGPSTLTSSVANLAGLTNAVEFSTSTALGRARIPAGSNYVRTGTKSVTLDASTNGANPDPVNYIIITHDMSAVTASAVTLDFWFMDHGEETDINDRTWIRGSNTDPWIEVYNFVSPNPPNGQWQNVVVNNLGTILANNGQSFTSTFAVRFGQQDNFQSSSPTASDGITIDDVSIWAPGVSGLSYAWSTGDTTSVVNNLMAGTYSVTITNGAGCTGVETATVTEPAILASTTMSDTNITCGNIINGAGSVNVTGGTAAYNYAWSNGASTAAFTGVVAGNYYVTVTDANGCTAIDSVEIQNLDTAVGFIAAQDLTVYLDAMGMVTINAMQVDNGSTDSCGISSMMLSDTLFTCSDIGTNDVVFAVTDVSGNTGYDTIVVTVMDTNPQLVFGNYTIFEPSCNGDGDGKIITGATGGTGPYTYSWSTGSNFTNLSSLPAGSYVLTITDAIGCMQVDTIEVTEPGALMANVTGTEPVCFGEGNGMVMSTPMGGTAPFTYQWNTGDVTDNVNNTFAGTYEVTVTDARNCITTEVFTLANPDQINISVTAPNLTCDMDTDGTASVVATGGTGALAYEWHTGSTATSISGLALGSYQITVTDANSCEMVSSYLVEADFPTPVVDLGPDQTITWQKKYTFNANNPGTFLWSTGETTQIIQMFVTTDTTVWVTVTNDGGCMGSDTLNIDLDEVISVDEVTQNDVKVFPNPTSGLTQLLVGNANAKEMDVMVLDISGAIITTQHYVAPQKGDRHAIDLSNFSNGMYFIKVQMDTEQFLFKINKQ